MSPHTLLTTTLLIEAALFQSHDGFGMRTSPHYWRMVFARTYGEFPKSNTDPRWDALFQQGFPLYRELYGA